MNVECVCPTCYVSVTYRATSLPPPTSGLPLVACDLDTTLLLSRHCRCLATTCQPLCMLILTSCYYPEATDHFRGSATYRPLASTCVLPPRPHHCLMCLLIPSCGSHGIATYLCHVILPQTPSSLSSIAVLLAGPRGSCLLGLCVVCLACSASPAATPHGVDNSLAILIDKATPTHVAPPLPMCIWAHSI